MLLRSKPTLANNACIGPLGGYNAAFVSEIQRKTYNLHGNVETNNSIWSSLRNPVYLRVWSALVVSGCCVTAHDMAATWAMNSMGASALLLSLMSTASTLPFFLFTLPAGALADLMDRRRLLRVFNCWLAVSAGILAICAF